MSTERSGLLVSELEAATVFQVSPEQIRRLITQGFLTHVGDTLTGVPLYRQQEVTE